MESFRVKGGSSGINLHGQILALPLCRYLPCPITGRVKWMSHRALKTVPGTKQVLIRWQLFLWFVLLSSLLSCPVTSLVRACMHSRPCLHHRLIPDPSSHRDFPLLFLPRHVSPSSPHCPAFFHSPIFGKWFLPKGNFAGFVHDYPGQRKTGTRKVLFDGWWRGGGWFIPASPGKPNHLVLWLPKPSSYPERVIL